MIFTPDKNINIEIDPSYITKENFRLSIDERIPKLIFKDDKYKKFSYQGIKTSFQGTILHQYSIYNING